MALPFLLPLSFKKKYKNSIPSRFFLKKNPSFSQEGVWFHACSLGEVRSLLPIIAGIKGKKINISVITQTGFAEASKIKNAEVRYLPFEIFLPFWIKKQEVLVVAEAELWLLLFWVTKKMGIKTVLMNARISDSSYAGYRRFAWFYRFIFGCIDEIFCQSDIDAKRLISLGADSLHVRINGNIKTFQDLHVTKKYQKPAGKDVVIFASTHEKEEEIILKNIKKSPKDTLIFAPRHPERFGKVDTLLSRYCQKNGFSYSRLKDGDDLNFDVVLCDLMGELINLYAIADVSVLGGSFVDGIGGHNPLEPAFFKNKIISGKYIFNQKTLFACVENSVLCEAEEIGNYLEKRDTLRASCIINSGDIASLVSEINGKNNETRKSL